MLLISELIHCLSVASAWHTATSAASHLLEMPPGHHISPCCQSSLIYLQCPQASKHLPSLLLLPSPIHFECPQPSIHLLLLLQPPIHLQCPQPNLLLLPKPPIHIYAPSLTLMIPFCCLILLFTCYVPSLTHTCFHYLSFLLIKASAQLAYILSAALFC